MKAENIFNGRGVQYAMGTPSGRSTAESGTPALTSALRLVLSMVAVGLFSAGSVYASSATATVGQSVTFSVTVDGTAPFSYQWFKNGASVAAAIDGTYTLPSVVTTDGGNYSVNITNASGSTTSDIATVLVTPALIVPAITSQPSAQTVTAGQSASFHVTATGSGPLTYQWKKTGTAISGATSSTYTIATTASSDAGNYSVVVSNSIGFASSLAALLTVSVPVTPPPGPATLADNSFEKISVGSDFFDAFVYGSTTTPWTFTGGAGITGNNSGFTSANPNAPNGGQVAFIQMGGSMGQDVVLAAGSYSITAQVANRANWGDQQTVLVYVDGQLVGNFKGGTAYSLVTTNTFTVTAGMHSIDFIGLATTDATLFLDQILLVSAPVTVGNNGFERPTVGSGSYYAFLYNPPAIAGVQDWTFVGNAGVTGNNSGFTSGNSDAPEGSQVAFLQSTGSSISQSIFFPAAGSYTLSLASGQRGNWNNAPQRANVYLDGALVGSFSPTSSTYESFSLSLPASKGTHVLSFKGMVSKDCTLLIDRVAILLP